MPIGDGKAQKETQKINEELGYILDAVSSIGDKLVASFEDAVDGAANLNDGVEIIGKTMQRGLAANLKAVVKSTENLINLEAKVNLGLASQGDLEKEKLRIQMNQAQLAVKLKTLAGSLTDEQKELLILEGEEIKKQQQQLKGLEKQLATNIKNKSLTDILKDNAESIADKIDKSGTLTQILKGGFGSVLNKTKLVEAAAVALFQAIVATDKQVGEMAKGMNITYQEALKLQQELQSAANLSMSTKVSAEGLGQALMAINSELGITNTTVSDNLVFFQEMHKYAGLTYEELQGVNAITNATGGDLKSNTGEILAQAKIQGTRLGVALNEKEVLKDISKVSAATTVSLGMSAEEIGKAVSVAKSLGLELGKVDDIASSILDFESSIEKELEAELLLGKDINLEKARTAALNNDLATLAEEIAKEAGSAADFAAMNRIEQEALAAAVGMGRDELGQMLFTQEQLVGLSGDEVALREKQINDLQAKGLSQDQIKEKLAKTSVEDLKKQVSAQENLAAAVSKLKELFTSIAVPVLAIVTPIVDILLPAVGYLGVAFEAIAIPINYVVGLFKDINEYLETSIPLMAALGASAYIYLGITQKIAILRTAAVVQSKALSFYEGLKNAKATVGLAIAKTAEAIKTKGLIKTIGEAAMSAFASVAKIPFIGPVLGIAAAAATAALGYKYLQGNDVMSPGESGGGYGNRTLMGPEGAIALNNKDTVIAGTNLFPKGDDVMSAPAGEIQMPAPADNSRMEGLLESLVRDQRARPVIANPGVIQIQ